VNRWEAQVQQSLTEMISRKEVYRRDRACQIALVTFICNDLQPISVVDSPGFCQLFLHALDPRFLPYSRFQFPG